MTVEHVLVFPARVLEANLPGFQGIMTGAEARSAAEAILNEDNLVFSVREDAEHDPTIKQIIPYLVIRNRNRVLSYTRTKKGGEARLHNTKSIGFGGHINPCDGSGNISYEKCFWREAKEELGLEQQPGEVMTPPVAILYEPWTEVGSVHFGIVHVLDVSDTFTWTPDVDASVADVEWIEVEQLRELAKSEGAFEGWSGMVIKNVLTETTPEQRALAVRMRVE